MIPAFCVSRETHMLMTMDNPKVHAELIPELLRSLPEEFHLNEIQIQQFEKYLNLLLQWNKKAGLISPSDENRLIKRHIIESLGVLSVNLLQPSAEVLDLGSGGGFPGVPIKISMPSLNMALLDSRRMKALFLEEVVRVLALENTHVVNDRAERVAANLSEKFDFVLVRAVADLETLWKWSQPLLKKGGSLLAQKGGDLKNELDQLLHSHPNLQPKQFNYPKSRPIDPSRYVIAIQKD